MKNTRTTLIAKHVVYALMLVILYTMQTTPGLFEIFGARPVLVVPFALSAAMLEGEFVGGVYGALAGLLCDMSGPLLFGFNGFFIAFFCIVAGLAVIYMMHCNAGGAMLFTVIAMLAVGSMAYMFEYGMWGYEGAWRVYVLRILPVCAYTTLATPAVFWLFRAVFRYFDKRLKPQ